MSCIDHCRTGWQWRFRQIVENGSNRQESIWRLAVMRRVNKRSSERFYDRGVNALLTFFSPNKIKGETHIEKC